MVIIAPAFHKYIKIVPLSFSYFAKKFLNKNKPLIGGINGLLTIKDIKETYNNELSI